MRYSAFEQKIISWARTCEAVYRLKGADDKTDYMEAAQVFKDGIVLIAYEHSDGRFQTAANLVKLGRTTYTEMYLKINEGRRNRVWKLRNG